jgi:hypothetical protein
MARSSRARLLDHGDIKRLGARATKEQNDAPAGLFAEPDSRSFLILVSI